MNEIEAILFALEERISRLASLYRDLKEEDPNSKHAATVMQHIIDIKKEIRFLRSQQSDELVIF